MKKKINPVEEEEQQQPQTQQNQNNNKDPEFEDAIHSFYLAKSNNWFPWRTEGEPRSTNIIK
jgi:hypothetical protein